MKDLVKLEHAHIKRRLFVFLQVDDVIKQYSFYDI